MPFKRKACILILYIFYCIPKHFFLPDYQIGVLVKVLQNKLVKAESPFKQAFLRDFIIGLMSRFFGEISTFTINVLYIACHKYILYVYKVCFYAFFIFDRFCGCALQQQYYSRHQTDGWVYSFSRQGFMNKGKSL